MAFKPMIVFTQAPNAVSTMPLTLELRAAAEAPPKPRHLELVPKKD